MWAAQLMPNRVLLVKIPEDVSLCLLRASIAPGPGGGDPTRSAVRCRTPAKQQPATLCYLHASLEELRPIGQSPRARGEP